MCRLCCLEMWMRIVWSTDRFSNRKWPMRVVRFALVIPKCRLIQNPWPTDDHIHRREYGKWKWWTRCWPMRHLIQLPGLHFRVHQLVLQRPVGVAPIRWYLFPNSGMEWESAIAVCCHRFLYSSTMMRRPPSNWKTPKTKQNMYFREFIKFKINKSLKILGQRGQSNKLVVKLWPIS